jgi:hypothetical protein
MGVVADEGKACEEGSRVALIEEGQMEVIVTVALTMREVGLGALCGREAAIRAHGCDTSTAQAKETSLPPCPLKQEIFYVLPTLCHRYDQSKTHFHRLLLHHVQEAHPQCAFFSLPRARCPPLLFHPDF